MRRIPAVATCVAAALSLALTGCGGDGKRDKGSSGSTASVEPAEKTPGKGGRKDGAEQTASPTPARTKKATPTPTRPATPTAAATPTRPRASAPAVPRRRPRALTPPGRSPCRAPGTTCGAAPAGG
ncbi:hypothetical protein [Streptomyces alboflavus]|uniref:hypothetical protein n=1 Tax=Streptomyces alboflavus TaxID=67267 RepID=UPI001331A3C8|nr:hypothetical protein [Streptomyces alboflavus]